MDYRKLGVNIDGLKFVLRALRHKNYRLFFIGQSISLTGSWMQVIAVSWLAYRLTNSAFLLGLVGFVSQIPTFIFSPFAGVLADHWNRKHILIITQTLAMIQALILAILTLTGRITVPHIMILSILLGLISAFDIPSRHSFVVDMLERREDLGNAIALNSLVFNLARLLGPTIAGIIIAATGEGVCFLINSVSYLAVIFALLAMNIKKAETPVKKSSVLEELKEGFVYVFGHPRIRSILTLVALVSLMGMSYAVLMPIFAKDVLRGGSGTLGFLMGSAGLGALVGAAYLAAKKSTHGMGKIISLATFIFSIALIVFSVSRIMWLSLASMLFAGFGIIIQMVASNTVLQGLTDDDKRGRVMSFYTVAFMGITPFGSLLAGTLASRIGAPGTLLISAFSCMLGAVFFAKAAFK